MGAQASANATYSRNEDKAHKMLVIYHASLMKYSVGS